MTEPPASPQALEAFARQQTNDPKGRGIARACWKVIDALHAQQAPRSEAVRSASPRSLTADTIAAVDAWLSAHGYRRYPDNGSLEICWNRRSGYDRTTLYFWQHDFGWDAVVGCHASGTNPRMNIGTCETLEDVQRTSEAIRRINGYPSADAEASEAERATTDAVSSGASAQISQLYDLGLAAGRQEQTEKDMSRGQNSERVALASHPQGDEAAASDNPYRSGSNQREGDSNEPLSMPSWRFLDAPRAPTSGIAIPRPPAVSEAVKALEASVLALTTALEDAHRVLDENDVPKEDGMGLFTVNGRIHAYINNTHEQIAALRRPGQAAQEAREIAVRRQERERCASQVQNMAFSIARMYQEPGCSAQMRELGRIRCEAMDDVIAALLFEPSDPPGRSSASGPGERKVESTT